MSHQSAKFEYDVAFSFAGEDRHLVEPIARRLREIGFSVFYDEYEQADLWGKDLYVHLHEVYSKRAQYCVMFASVAYAQKAWPSHERRAAQERAFFEKGAQYILPIRIDATEIPGIPQTLGYIDASAGTERICDLLARKLAGAAAMLSNGHATSSASSNAIATGAGMVPAPFGMVAPPPAPIALGRGSIPCAVSLLGQVAAPELPTREVLVVPYDLNATHLGKAAAMQQAKRSQLRQARGSTVFPVGPLEEPSVREATGLVWDEKPRPDWHLQFALGFDGSFSQREFISETRRAHPRWGSGVGLFSTLDRVIGAVMFAQRLSSRGVRWLMLTLAQIEGQRLAFDYDSERAMAADVFARNLVTNSSVVRACLNFDAAIKESDIVRLALAVGEDVAFYFGWSWNENWVVDEVKKTMANIIRQG